MRAADDRSPSYLPVLRHHRCDDSDPVFTAFAKTETGFQPPSYQLNCADEDYSYLRDPAKRQQPWDPIKYLPLNGDGSWYLSIGGEARERYEYFRQRQMGKRAPRTRNGTFLQRYFLHGDLHLGDNSPPFTSSSRAAWKKGGRGGPRGQMMRTSSIFTRLFST